MSQGVASHPKLYDQKEDLEQLLPTLVAFSRSSTKFFNFWLAFR